MDIAARTFDNVRAAILYTLIDIYPDIFAKYIAIGIDTHVESRYFENMIQAKIDCNYMDIKGGNYVKRIKERSFYKNS